MRLLHCKTLVLEEFFKPPPYAILSHTWEQDEITYQEMLSPNEETFRKDGYIKIKKACELALGHDYDYIWVDTCCIDKKSSAELSEAINSMYKWYQRAGLCIVLLTDVVTTGRAVFSGVGSFEREHREFAYKILNSCKWITRGWTLQELIAPAHVLFYDRDCNCFGSKRDLRDPLSQVSGIDRDVLESSDPTSASIAARMKWAASRETSREEDLAYCLLGLFNVNMPLLYGEGDRAFIRLQEEILKSSDDQSLFAWNLTKSWHHDRFAGVIYSGLLAQHPRDFWRATAPAPAQLFEDQWTTSTNKGIRITLPLVSLQDHEALDYLRPSGDEEWPWYLFQETFATADDLHFAILNCDKGLAMILMKLEDRHQFARVYPHILVQLNPKGLKPKRLYIRQDVRLSPRHQSTAIAALSVQYNDYVNYDSGRSRVIDASSHWAKMPQSGTSGPIVHPDSIGRVLFRTEVENTINFGYYGDEADNDIFTFSLEISSRFQECVEITEGAEQAWRLRNIGEQKKYDAPFEIDEDPDPWYNRWRGSVKVIFKLHRAKGVYEVRVLHGKEGQSSPTDFEMSPSREHSNFGNTVQLAKLGTGKARMSAQATTRWNGKRAVVALVVREFIVDKRDESDDEADDVLWRMDEMKAALAKTRR